MRGGGLVASVRVLRGEVKHSGAFGVPAWLFLFSPPDRPHCLESGVAVCGIILIFTPSLWACLAGCWHFLRGRRIDIIAHFVRINK